VAGFVDRSAAIGGAIIADIGVNPRRPLHRESMCSAARLLTNATGGSGPALCSPGSAPGR
jgi:hypothetical protein